MASSIYTCYVEDRPVKARAEDIPHFWTFLLSLPRRCILFLKKEIDYGGCQGHIKVCVDGRGRVSAALGGIMSSWWGENGILICIFS
jgi:hypothetical protein